jgi:hypothetical protein
MISAPDWNWFFSSVAQSVAALVGTLLAFVIASILNNQAAFGRRRDRMSELAARSERLKEAAEARFFHWYNRRRLENALESLEATLEKEKERKKPEEYFAQLHVSAYQPRQEVVAAIGEMLKAFDARKHREAIERQRRASTTAYGLGSLMPDLSMLSSSALQASRLQTASGREELENEGEMINQLRIDVNDHVRTVSMLHREAVRHPESAGLVRVTLIAAGLLFAFGVIYPLSFLPVAVPWDGTLSISAFFTILFSLRGVVLLLAAVTFGALVGILWYINASLRHTTTELATLATWLRHSSYSSYLDAFRKNREASSSAVVA